MKTIKDFKILILIGLTIITSQPVVAQTAILKGKVVSDKQPVEFANVALKGTQFGVATNAEGNFVIKNIPSGTYRLVVSAVGFVSISDTITLKDNETRQIEYELKEDVLNLTQVVVTGSRNAIERYNSSVIVNTIGSGTFESTQSINIAEGLNFSTGLRVENNCQNCGFTQLRMNGLDGPYTQILINSRPVFSALAGVYGLEMLPSTMVSRIEVLRGGGSVMYGGSAIAGTVNIITKEPFENSFEVGMNQAFTNGEVGDRTVNLSGAVVSENANKGISFFGFNRVRGPWDANGDGFSEMVKLKNNTFGFDAFYNTSSQSHFKFGAYYINEFRRGGNKFDLLPHQTDICEQLRHHIINTNLAFEQFSKNNKHKFKLFGSLQNINRASYYGGGGRVVADGDTLTPSDLRAINAYGNSKDISTVSGAQYSCFFNRFITLSVGSEYTFNDVSDQMPGYGRKIDQRVATWGTFAELEIKPVKKLTLLLGSRYDRLFIKGKYDLDGENFKNHQNLAVFIPRLTAMFSFKDNFKLRASFAQGYRGPQAFNEDLHIETVGGAARFIRIDPSLEVERSKSGTISLNYDDYVGENQMNFVLEGFRTLLANPFIFSGQEQLPSGVSAITKRNGTGAVVSGVNIEANIAFDHKLIIQSGATLQYAIYEKEEEIWKSREGSTPDFPATTTSRLLRTPNAYGFFTLVFKPTKPISVSFSGVFTGSMDVPHVIDKLTERTVIKQTPVFVEKNIKASYTIYAKKQFGLEFFVGVQNISNSFQKDFDFGAARDAGYVYGPLRPRTFFIGLKFKLI